MTARRLDPVTYQRIREVISSHVGRRNAIRAREILAVLRAAGTPTHSRRVTETIRAMRDAGEPVLSHSSFGVWMAETEDERAQAASELRKRIASLNRSLYALDAACAGRVQMALELEVQP